MTAAALTRPPPHLALVEAGLAHHRAGALDAAADAYAAALRLAPGDGQLWKLAGILALQRAQPAEAVASFETAAASLSDDAELFGYLAMARREQGDLTGAVEAGRRAVALDPGNGDAQLELGRALLRLDDFAAAIVPLSCAYGKHGERPETLHFLAMALKGAGFHARAAAAFREVIARNPDDFDALNNLGIVLHDAGDSDGAIRCYAELVERAPGFVEPLVNYSTILNDRNMSLDALVLLNHAVERHPRSVGILFNQGACLGLLHRLEEALVVYDKVLALEPTHKSAIWNRALALLALGKLEEGFDLYEQRWDVQNFTSRKQHFEQPLWQGEELAGRTLLFHAEQGIGDTLQFIRYAPLIVARGGRVVLQCQKSLVPLLTGMPGLAGVLAKEEPLPPFDVHLPIMSVPQRFRTGLATIPPPVPYRPIEPAILPTTGPFPAERFKVGLVWAGNPVHGNDAYRSVPIATLEGLLGIEGVAYFSLQVGAPVPDRPDLIDLGSGFRDFADTAAAIAALDLVISVDTSPAHLAGTLGTPTFLMLPLRSDWRWLSRREDTPWYPGMRLFWQPQPGDWAAVVARIRTVLQAMAAAAMEKRGSPAKAPLT